jgi:prepilin-type N-terminal cleavage/methylation domain-containing protein
MKVRRTQAGFTLLEVVAALAILGGALLVLVDMHYGSMRLFDGARQAVIMQSLTERALGRAEMEVMAGKLEGSGDFGKRYPDYSYTFQATPMTPDSSSGAAAGTTGGLGGAAAGLAGGSSSLGGTSSANAQSSPLLGVNVTVIGPEETRMMQMLVFSMGQ